MSNEKKTMLAYFGGMFRTERTLIKNGGGNPQFPFLFLISIL